MILTPISRTIHSSWITCQLCESLPRYFARILRTALLPQEEDYKTNSYLRALRNLDYSDDYGPDELALDCKDRGNQAFKRGSKFYGNALKFYNDALRHISNATPCEEITNLESIVHSNLAAIFMARCKVQYALDECLLSLKLWPENVKAGFRAAKCAIQLGRYTEGQQLCEAALSVAPGNAALQKQLAAAQAGVAKVQRATQGAAAESAKQRAHLQCMRDACKERGIAVGGPLFEPMRRSDDRPHITEDGCMHWPLLVLYPQSGHTDYIRSWPEVETVAALVNTLLPSQGGSGGLPWDAEGSYSSGNVDVFYRANPVPAQPLHEAWSSWLPALPGTEDSQEAGAAASSASTSASEAAASPSAAKAPVWVRVPLHAPLLLPLVQSNYVVPEIPVLHVVPRGTHWAATWRAEALRGMKAADFPELQVPDFNA